MEGNTEKVERVLALWLDLQSAIQSRKTHVKRQEGCTPWACPDSQVRQAWQKLTDGRNSLAFERLFFQLGEGPQLGLAREALQACRCNSRKA